MDKTILLHHLAEVEGHIAQGETHLAQQRALIAAMERKKEDVAQALAILDTFIESQALHEQERERLVNALKDVVP